MAKSNKTVDSGCWRGFEEKGNFQSLKTAPATLETIVENPQKAKNKVRFLKNGSSQLNKSSCGLVLFLPHATANMS